MKKSIQHSHQQTYWEHFCVAFSTQTFQIKPTTTYQAPCRERRPALSHKRYMSVQLNSNFKPEAASTSPFSDYGRYLLDNGPGSAPIGVRVKEAMRVLEFLRNQMGVYPIGSKLRKRVCSRTLILNTKLQILRSEHHILNCMISWKKWKSDALEERASVQTLEGMMIQPLESTGEIEKSNIGIHTSSDDEFDLEWTTLYDNMKKERQPRLALVGHPRDELQSGGAPSITTEDTEGLWQDVIEEKEQKAAVATVIGDLICTLEKEERAKKI